MTDVLERSLAALGKELAAGREVPEGITAEKFETVESGGSWHLSATRGCEALMSGRKRPLTAGELSLKSSRERCKVCFARRGWKGGFYSNGLTELWLSLLVMRDSKAKPAARAKLAGQVLGRVEWVSWYSQGSEETRQWLVTEIRRLARELRAAAGGTIDPLEEAKRVYAKTWKVDPASPALDLTWVLVAVPDGRTLSVLEAGLHEYYALPAPNAPRSTVLRIPWFAVQVLGLAGVPDVAFAHEAGVEEVELAAQLYAPGSGTSLATLAGALAGARACAA